jgi:hypothetical protein
MSVLDFLKATEGTNDIEHGSALHGRATGDCIVSSRVEFGGSAGGLGDVQRNGERSTSELVAKFSVSSRDLGCHLNGDSHEVDSAPIDVHLLEAEHACVSANDNRSCAVAVAVAVKDHAHVNAHVNVKELAT